MKTNKILMFLVIAVFMISFVSAADWDNTLRYEKNDMKVTIKNAFGLPIIGSDLGTVELKSHKSANQVLEVAPGKDRVVMYYDLNFNGVYKDGLGNVEFVDMGSREIIEKDYHFVIWDTIYEEKSNYSMACNDVYNKINNSHNEICENILVGTYIQESKGWIKLDTSDIPNGKVRIGLATNVNLGEHIDGIWTIAGKKIKRHAEWTGNLNTGIVSYWKFDDNISTTNVIDSTGNFNGTASTNTINLFSTDAIINNSFNFVRTSSEKIDTGIDVTDYSAYSISLWMKWDGVNNMIIMGQDVSGQRAFYFAYNAAAASGSRLFYWDGTTSHFTDDLLENTWYHIVITQAGNGTGGTNIYQNADLNLTATGSIQSPVTSTVVIGHKTNAGTYFNGNMDEVGIWSRVLTSDEVSALYNNGDGITYTDVFGLVVLNYPENNSIINNPEIEFNWTLSPSGFNITNWTLNVFHSNGTIAHQHINTSININETLDVIHNDTLLLDESYMWNVEACQTNGVCFNASNQTFILDTAPPVVNITYPPEGLIVSVPQENITLNYTVIHPVGNLSNCFYNTTSNSTPTNISCTINTTSFLYPITNPNNLTIFVFANDTAGNLGSDNVTIFKDETSPQVNITAPIGTLDYNYAGGNETLNWTVSDAGLDSCWYNYNGTNVTINCSLNTTEFNIEYNNYNLTFYANDTFGNENSSLTLWGYKIFEINQTFNNMTTEGATEQFTINLVKDSSFQISTIDLIYNGTINSFPYSVSGDEVTAQSSITIPVVDSDTNITFYWNITLDDDSSIITRTNNQTILSINVDNCSSFTNVIYNFTQYDEENKSILSGNNTIELQINLFDTEHTSLLTSFSNKFEGVNPVQFCSEASILTTVNYSSYVIVKYFVNSTSEDHSYSVEYYNILNQTIGNTTIPINVALYNLKVPDTTKFRLTFRDDEYVLAPNILVQVHRQYIQDNGFTIVEIPLTDSNGQTILNLVKNTIIYNFIMVNEAGQVVGTFNSIAAFCSDFSIGDCTINLAPDSPSEDMYDYNEEFDISISDPSYDNSTKKISISFVTADLTPKNVRMEIVRNNDFGNRSVCSDSLFSASGTLFCNVSSITDTDQFLFISTFVEDDLAKKDTTNLNANILNFGTLNGAFYAFFFILILITLFMEDRKILVISLGLGWVGVISLGLINGKFIGFTSAGIWIIVSIAIFLWKLNQEDSV